MILRNILNLISKIALLLAAYLFWLGGLTGLLYLLPAQRPLAEGFAISPTFYDREGTLFHVRLSSSQEWLLPVPLHKMGRWLPLTTLAVEDSRFYEHPGVDPLALLRACSQNLRSGRVVSGASTITSQLIRIAQPRERSLKAKGLEFIQALRLEQELSKDEILELYLNRAPFGGPVRGAEAAARQYFGKSTAELSLAESATLVSLLRGPTYYRPDRQPELLRARRDYILDLLQDKGLVNTAELTLAKAEKIPRLRRSMPAQARHYVDLILRRLPPDSFQWNARKESADIDRLGLLVCSLDLRQQQELESALRLNLTDLSPGITAAAAVIDNQSGQVLCYVGNARYAHGQGGNWVDCAQAPRSPGSLLKPFIYLAAFERGLYTPASLVADAPLALSGRAPRNFDEKYRGPVSVNFALAESLNAPAVRVLRKVGYQESLLALRQVGFELLTRDSAHYGDSLSIGGCEITLYQALRAYSTLARLGIEAHPKLLLPKLLSPKLLSKEQSASDELTSPLFSEASAWLIAEILRDNNHQSSSALSLAHLMSQEDPHPIAFKTGTSFGLRDAWTAAYTPKYTMLVWFGNPSGRPDSHLVGLRTAAPVALSFLRQLSQAYEVAPSTVQTQTQAPVSPHLPRWYKLPHGVERYQACSVSGQTAGPACQHTHTAWRVSNASRSIPCTLHSEHAGMTKLTWPAELAEFAARRTENAAETTRISITSPLPGGKIFMNNDQRTQKIPLRCEGASGKVFWFVDQNFLTEQAPGESVLWPLSPGRHILSLADEKGRTATAEVRVAALGGLSTHTPDGDLVPVLTLKPLLEPLLEPLPPEGDAKNGEATEVMTAEEIE